VNKSAFCGDLPFEPAPWMRSVPIISKGGRLVSIASPPDAKVADLAATHGVQSSFFPGDPGHDTLQQITDLIDAGTLRVTVTEEYPLARAAEALAKNRQGPADACWTTK
jgi:NADPH:quinone reductase-like Zn-dependent oxidoreductase